MRWRGTTPDGMPIEIELDAERRWVVTIAACTRSADRRLASAIDLAGGGVLDRGWTQAVVRRLERDAGARAADAVTVPSSGLS